MNRTEKLVRYFLAHRSVTIELINKIEKEHYDYKPTPTSMSAKQLVTHILLSFYRFAKTAKSGDQMLFREKIEETETDLRKLAENYTEKTRSLLESLTDEDFERTIDLTKIFGSQMSVAKFLQGAMDHEIHHKGQLFVYVREMGHTELPFFIKRS
ncbi:DinB family protein [Bacillus methanolicus]|uniref:DinB family protein n=1 Tax=Bacillus methanolicus (strain MGA3 / ATCC 53907) TaxID=796606 RepID=I3E7V1_BACMM|nr:DinB family protein [Bacillus methanolicus]AIE59390.1 DinB family protein [Bacillus methanolicus MGA3]EIJ82572.1 DinB family protein [Bacillus methanolicus MGA3]